MEIRSPFAPKCKRIFKFVLKTDENDEKDQCFFKCLMLNLCPSLSS